MSLYLQLIVNERFKSDSDEFDFYNVQLSSDNLQRAKCSCNSKFAIYGCLCSNFKERERLNLRLKKELQGRVVGSVLNHKTVEHLAVTHLIFFFNSRSGGWSPNGSTRHVGLLYMTRVIMMIENLVE
jgi:hypothetical protein